MDTSAFIKKYCYDKKISYKIIIIDEMMHLLQPLNTLCQRSLVHFVSLHTLKTGHDFLDTQYDTIHFYRPLKPMTISLYLTIVLGYCFQKTIQYRCF